MSQQGIYDLELERLQVELEFTICTIAQLFDEFEPNVFAKPHRVSFNAIIYIVNGQGEHHIDHKLYRYKPGTIMFLSQYQVHHFDYNPDIEGYVVSFKDEMLHYGNDDPYESKIKTALENVNCIYDTDEKNGFYFEQLSQEFLNQQDNLSGEIIRSTMRTLMLKTLVRYHQSFIAHQKRSPDDLDFMRLRELIESHYYGTRTVADYARMMGKTTKKVNQIVKDNTGKTVKELIDDRVMLEAKRLLAYSQYSIANIAVILGFNEATNMTKFFRRHTELTPKEFRELCRHNVAKTNIEC